MMTKLKWFGALVLMAMFGAPKVYASDIYFAQAAAGAKSASDCADARALSTIGGSDWAAGNTIHLCGTITGTSNTNILVVGASGTASAPITIKWEPNAILQEGYCPQHGTGGCVQVSGHSFITLDGGTNGIIQNTANGTNLTNHQSSTAIENDGGSNFIVKNLTIQNIYVHTSTSDSATGDDATNCIYNNGSANNWIIAANTMHDMSWCIEIQYGTTSNITISKNNIYNIDHGIALGGPSAGHTLSNVTVNGNNIHDYSNWDTSGDSYHHDGIHIWGNGNNGSDPISNVNIYDNTFGGCIGINVTAHIFIEANAGANTGFSIFNNVLIDTCAGASNDGLLTTGVDSGYKIYNNVFMGSSNDTCMGTSSSPNVTFVNNVVSGCNILMYIASGGGFASGGLHHNVYAACPGSNCFAYRGAFSGSLSTWQSETGQDAIPSIYVASAGLNSAGQPLSGSTAINGGANLTSLGIIALDSDILGTLRPSTGAWTAGAYSFGAVSGQPAPPTGVKVITQ